MTFSTFNQYMWLLTHFCEGDHNILSQIMLFWHIDFFFFQLKAVEKYQTQDEFTALFMSAWKQNLNTLPTIMSGEETGESYWD